MSVTKQLREVQSTKKSSARQLNGDNSHYPAWISANLTQDEKEYLLSNKDTWPSLDSIVKEFLENNLILKMSKNVETNYIEVALREKHLHWKDAKQISLTAATEETALVGLHYVLTKHYRGWPQKPLETIEF